MVVRGMNNDFELVLETCRTSAPHLPKTKKWWQCNALCGIVLPLSKRSRDSAAQRPHLYRAYLPGGDSVVFVCSEKMNPNHLWLAACGAAQLLASSSVVF